MTHHLNWVFPADRFAVMKTFREDDSVFYCMSSIGTEAARATNYLIPDCKANYIFLKVQIPSYDAAYDILEKKGVKLDPDCRNGLRNSLLGMTGQYLDIFEHTQGSQIKRLIERNEEELRLQQDLNEF
ncbi:hypothetical protein EPUS_07162 [Endocarpon pusillum Z07020]|uniref:Uncharacterized protein n=1 Tax=Endocarpon pusillum (strain Z07020 / HMAS-L-300199) TaxID=1263415 RepID=U1GA99_ENDPU|nr:uncharacterized protein EPUS_07162 [Endocarpon pusillum Z07020]ERF68601.1 hypothetical protein EPUS_07162 [Endocarpon pusillum Z07020]